MVDMKMSVEEQAEQYETAITGRQLYPYGLCIYLDDDSLEKLGLQGEYLPKLDQVMELKIKVQVTSINSMKVRDEDESSCSLQITEMEVVEAESKDYAKALYGPKGDA